MRILSGDIGGTKTRIALVDVVAGNIEIWHEETYPSADHRSLETIVREFLGKVDTLPQGVGFGVAGSVRNNRSETTNLPWVIDARAMEHSLNLPHVHVINDLEATAWGIGALSESDLYELHPGNRDPAGNISIIAAGTGLGEAGMCRNGEGVRPFASEGGHTDFAPANELEFALLQFLSRHYGHVSWERVVSGIGIADIYRFLCHHENAEPPPWLREQLHSGDAGAAISRAADSGPLRNLRKDHGAVRTICTVGRRATTPSRLWQQEAYTWGAASPRRSCSACRSRSFWPPFSPRAGWSRSCAACRFA